jgi:hypothetical protein
VEEPSKRRLWTQYRVRDTQRHLTTPR